jgi:hypothetical protein
VIPPGLLASGRGIRRKNGIPPGLLAHGHGFRPARSKIFQSITIPGSLTLKDLYHIRLIFKNLNMKTSLKWKINLIRAYNDLQIYPMKSKKGTKIWWDSPFNRGEGGGWVKYNNSDLILWVLI